MRRKSGRSGRSSPEKTDSSRKSRRQSSRKHKRSSSQSSVESDDGKLKIKEPAQHVNNNPTEDNKANSVSINSDAKAQSPVLEDKGKSDDNIETGRKMSSNRGSPINKKSEDSQDLEMGIEEKEEKKIKGKSKGKNKSNIEKSSNIIEPEIENENVQGTPQSPSNDNADNENIQNVNDTEKNVGEHQEENEEIKSESEATIKEQIVTELDVKFESEYTQQPANTDNRPSKILEGQRQKSEECYEAITKQSAESKLNVGQKDFYDKEDHSSKRSSKDERSMTPELKDNEENEISNSNRKPSDQSNQEKNNGGEISSKKKIILRRSSLINKETDKSEDVFLDKENKLVVEESGKDIDQEKPRKKITLKRNNIDERTSNEDKGILKMPDEYNNRLSTNEEQKEKKRRLSSFCEDKGQDGEDKPRNLKKIKLLRRLSRGNDESYQETTKQLSALRRHMWNRSDWLDKLTFYNVDVDSIKIVCPSLKFLGEDELHLEATPRDRRKSESDFKRMLSMDKSDDSDRPVYEKQTSEESLEQKVELNPNIIAMNRKISIVDDTASKLKPPPSPSKHPVSEVLYITNLVRPFTVKQLKELLERTGKIKAEGFWTDRIKSKCYVHYESIEEAEATRNALHGVHWPIGNGKQLVIDYATVDDLEKAKNPAPVPKPIVDKVPEKENREPVKIEEKFRDKEREEREEKKRKDGTVREWDLGKEDSRRGRSKSRSRERTRKHSRRSYTPEITEYIHRKQRKMEEPVPQKLMDDLFLKTKATPSIYWQPLTPEEIAMKQKQRLVRMEEHKRRIEETRVRLRDNRRGSFRRR